MEDLLKRTKNMPIPVVATAVAACTLGNVYGTMGYTLVRHLSMIFGTIIFLFYLIKFLKYPDQIKADYGNTVFASLYGTFSMLLMLISSYYISWIPAFKYVLIFAVILHAIHICIFLFLKLFKNFDINVFVPSWYVTLNGIMVSTVIGATVLPTTMAMAVLYWGIFAYTVSILFMVYRLFKYEVKAPMFHTQAILLAPCSLIVVSYINLMETPNVAFLAVYYTCVLLSLLFIIIMLPKFFSFSFAPGFAGLTFPMAIGIVASLKMSGFLASLEMTQLSNVVKQIAGIQIYLTTAIVAFVLFNFYKMLMKK